MYLITLVRKAFLILKVIGLNYQEQMGGPNSQLAPVAAVLPLSTVLL